MKSQMLTKHLEEMEVQLIPIKEGREQFEVVNKGDIVILPAHGATVAEMLVLSDKNVQIVDITCSWVSKAPFADIGLFFFGKQLFFKKFNWYCILYHMIFEIIEKINYSI